MVLLTGASGFIGQALAHRLGEEVVTLGRGQGGKRHVQADLADTKQITSTVIKALRPFGIRKVIHSAGVTPWSGQLNFTDDKMMARSIAAICNELEIEELFFVSGWVVYDSESAIPYRESFALQPGSDYGLSKLEVERYLAKALTHTRLVNLRAASIYGPGQISPGLIPNLAKEVFTTGNITLNACTTRRDYLYIDDFVSAVTTLLKLSLRAPSTNLNIGSGNSISVEEVAQSLQKVCQENYGINAEIVVSDKIQEAEVSDNQLDITAARELGLLKHVTPFEKGLEAYIAWGKHANIL
jgi:UDP-glucose 4-epimerase